MKTFATDLDRLSFLLEVAVALAIDSEELVPYAAEQTAPELA